MMIDEDFESQSSASAPSGDRSYSEYRKSVDGIGVTLHITDDLDEFVQQWRGTPESEAPGLHEVSEVSRGETIGLVLLFSKLDEGNRSFKPRVSFRIFRPDGTLYGEIVDSIAWSHGSLTRNILYLSDVLMSINIEEDDPVGEYLAEATFTANRNSKPIVVTRSFEVVSSWSAISLNRFFQSYYLQPNPEIVEEAIDYIGEMGLFDADRETLCPVFAFFVHVFSENQQRLAEWTAAIERQPQSCKKELGLALVASKNPEQMFKDKKPSAVLNDLSWGAFFASGDLKHVERLIGHVPHIEERDNATVFLAGYSAKWSLAANCMTHPVVRAAVESALDSANGTFAQDLRDVLKMDPNQIDEKTKIILQNQRKLGKWKEPREIVEY